MCDNPEGNGVVSDPQHAAAHALEAQCVAATLASISRPFSFQVSSDPRQTLPRTSLADEGAYQAHFAACTICGPAAEAGRVIARHFLNWPGRGERGNFAPPPPISAHPCASHGLRRRRRCRHAIHPRRSQLAAGYHRREAFLQLARVQHMRTTPRHSLLLLQSPRSMAVRGLMVVRR